VPPFRLQLVDEGTAEAIPTLAFMDRLLSAVKCTDVRLGRSSSEAERWEMMAPEATREQAELMSVSPLDAQACSDVALSPA